jgi:hypothetical protein
MVTVVVFITGVIPILFKVIVKATGKFCPFLGGLILAPKEILGRQGNSSFLQ